MNAASAEWLDRQVDRLTAGQRAAVDTAKLVATFAVAVAAALVGSALEVGRPSTGDHWALWLLGGSVVLGILVVLLDRVAVADHAAVLERAVLSAWDEDRLVKELRIAGVKAANANDGVVRDVRIALAAQLLVTLAAGGLAGASLLRAL